MGVYVTTKCGHCSNNWQFFQYGGNSVCGAPNVKCHHCHGMNSTKMDLYRNFDLKDKISFFITEIIFGIGFSFLLLGIGGYFFFTFFIEQNFFDFSISKDPWYWIIIGKLFIAFISLGPLYVGLNSIYNKLTIYKQIKKMEKVYDEQGGFLWSNQQY
jgi:hypothetical protein